MTALLVALGGALGSVLRYLTDQHIARRAKSTFPWGTLTVNTVGSAILGVLTAWSLHGTEPGAVRALLGVGLCGGLTTFSTFSYETLRLLTTKNTTPNTTKNSPKPALTNLLLTLTCGFTAAALPLLLWR
jgi:CrcB protein